MQLAVKAYVNVPIFKDNPAQIIQFLFIIMNDYTKIHESNTIPLIQFSKVVKRISEMQYDPFQCPPDIQKAKNHGLANRVSIPIEDENICECCGMAINNEQFPIQTELKDLVWLGVTFPLYFQFIKKCAFLFVVQFFMGSFYNLVLNIKGQKCDKGGFVCNTSIYNANVDQSLAIQGMHNIVTLVILIFLIELFKIGQEYARFELEQNRVTPADFTLQISGFNKNLNLQYDKIQGFTNKILNKVVDTYGIYFLLDMKGYCKEYQKKMKLMNKINKLKIKQKSVKRSEKKEQLLLRVDKIDKQLDQYEKAVQQTFFINKTDNISFNSEQSNTIESVIKIDNQLIMHRIVKKQSKSINLMVFSKSSTQKLKPFMYEGDILRVKRAAEPSDVVWMNVGSNQVNQRFFINFIILFIFMASFTGLLFLKYKIREITQNYSYNLVILFSLTTSTIVALTNTIVGIMIRMFAGKETHKKQTNYFVSVGRRLSYLFFINMVLTTYFSNSLSFNEDEYTISWKNSIQELMVNDFFFLFITNTYLSSIFNYFDFVWGYRLIRRYMAEQDLLNDQCSLSQQDLNSLFEGHPVDMALRYANVVKLMFFTAAVSPILPVGLPMSLLGLLILYWVDKYLLLRRYSCKNYLDAELAKEMMNILPLYTVFFSIGNMLIFLSRPAPENDNWGLRIRLDTNFFVALFGIILAIIYRYLFNLNYFQKLYFMIFKIKTPVKIIDKTYRDYLFSTSYEQFHPVLKNYSEGLKQNLQLFKNIRTSLQK
ncbi:hypothetical protein pb186bvf_013326 [Paramecium bursaria]